MLEKGVYTEESRAEGQRKTLLQYQRQLGLKPNLSQVFIVSASKFILSVKPFWVGFIVSCN